MDEIDALDETGLYENVRLDPVEKRARELAIVEATLNRRSFDSRRNQLSPVAILIRLIRSAVDGNLQAMTDIANLVVQYNNFRSLDSSDVAAFKSLQKSYAWLDQDMYFLYDMMLVDQIGTHWAISETFYILYDLPLPLIYCGIVQNFSQLQFDDNMTLLDYMEWCITPEVATIFSDPTNEMTKSAMRAWWEVAQDGPISGYLTFGATVKLLGFNMAAKYGPVRHTLFSIMTRVDAQYPYIDACVAHILYPSVFPYEDPPTTPNDIVIAIEIAMQGHATLNQITQICPYSFLPDDRMLMADIVRMALNKGRADVAFAYGLGPDILEIIYAANPEELWATSVYDQWNMADFLSEIPDSIPLSKVVMAMTRGSKNRQHIIKATADYGALDRI